MPPSCLSFRDVKLSPGYSLESLLSPVSSLEFRERYWEKDYLFISRGDPSFYRSLFSMSDVDRCIYSRRHDMGLALTFVPPAQSGNTARQFRVSEVSMDSLYKSFNSGATLRVENVQETWAPVAAMTASLESALDSRLTVNLYLTPKDAQGFKLHYDFHDAFILQVDGAKEWSIYEPEIHLPLETPLFMSSREAAEVRIAEDSVRLLRKVRLETGDLLYVPRGFPHKAVAVGTHSLHLTVGIRPVYWMDFLKTAIERACTEEPSLRGSMEPGFLTAPEVQARMREVFGSMLRRACEGAGFDQTLEVVGREHFAARQYPPDGHFAQLVKAADLVLDDRVQRRAGLRCGIEIESTTATLHFATNMVRGPLSILPALEFLRDQTEFQVRDLPELSDNSKLVLARRAICEGLLLQLPG
jgi:ribosomal protein L16 Arg81 hydroxylase